MSLGALPVHLVKYIFNFDEGRLLITTLFDDGLGPLLFDHFVGLYYLLIALSVERVVGVAIGVVLQ